MQDDKFSMITEYNVCNQEELNKTAHELQSSHFTNLEIFRIKNCHEILDSFLCTLIIRSQNLEVINIEQCTSVGDYSIVLRSSYINRQSVGGDKFFKHLKVLKLTKVYNMNYIWFISNRNYIDLGNLQILHIKHVPCLKYIFSDYPVEKLHQLKELIIENCEELYIVFRDQFNEVSPRTNFQSLSKVEFKSLPRLRQIYNGHLEFPSLKSLMIEKCPIFDDETLETDGKSFFELNETVFESYDNLTCVISSKTLQEMRNLKKLIVSHCKELKIVFKIHQEISNSTQLLPQLCELVLNDLAKLTRIVNKELSRLYQNLKILQVKQCKSLNLLQVPQKLTNLEIYDCEALDKIIIAEEEEEVEGMRGKLTFHELKEVSLENLPSLSVVFRSISEFPSLQTLKIANCCTMISFIEDSKALEESSTTNCFFPSLVSFHYKLFIKCILHGKHMFSFLSFDIGN